MIHHLVFSGGGVKGICLIGCLKALEESHILDNIKTYVGTSIGSLIAFLINIGYNHNELLKKSKEFNYEKIGDVDIWKLTTEFGIDTGENVKKYIEKMIYDKIKKKQITFIELFNSTNKRLVITSTCVNKGITHYFDYISNPNMNIVDAIRMSISVPFLFTSVKYNNYYYVDGGLLDNFPIHLFPLESDEVLGIKITNNIIDVKDINDFGQYFQLLLRSLVHESEKVRIQHSKCKNVIYIDTKEIESFNFNLSSEEKKILFDEGYMSVLNYLKKNHNIFDNNKYTVKSISVQTDNKSKDKSTQIYIS